MKEICLVLGYQNFTLGNYRKTAQFLLNHALQNGNSMYLHRTAKKNYSRWYDYYRKAFWKTRQRVNHELVLFPNGKNKS